MDTDNPLLNPERIKLIHEVAHLQSNEAHEIGDLFLDSSLQPWFENDSSMYVGFDEYDSSPILTTTISKTYEESELNGHKYESRLLYAGTQHDGLLFLVFTHAKQHTIMKENLIAYCVLPDSALSQELCVATPSGQAVKAEGARREHIADEFYVAHRILSGEISTDNQSGESVTNKHEGRVAIYPDASEFEHIKIDSLDISNELKDYLAVEGMVSIADFLKVSKDSDVLRGYMKSDTDQLLLERNNSVNRLRQQLLTDGIRIDYDGIRGSRIQLRAKLDHVPKDELGMSIGEFAFSARTYNRMRQAGIRTIEDLLGWWTQSSIMRIPNFGKKSFDELTDVLAKHGLALLIDPNAK